MSYLRVVHTKHLNAHMVTITFVVCFTGLFIRTYSRLERVFQKQTLGTGEACYTGLIPFLLIKHQFQSTEKTEIKALPYLHREYKHVYTAALRHIGR